jgi:creatinine amidohydrolase/Fe(II)-dependent formamide hydrolase-like protein
MRRRGVGRLAIGDEYDTTVTGEYHGIPHFSGLYDQSRYFDERVTRLFDDLGWGVQVFSVVRPCGELLIERVLATRYPDLLAAQVSCHATTVSEDRARPCGACEKCRRVVAMLTANGADPAPLGYPPDVARTCLIDFARRGVHQDPDDAEHLAWRLARSGKIPADSPMGRAAREHPHVESLRVDPERSPPEVVPDDVYARVMSILVRHAPVVRRREAGWVRDELPTPQIGDPLRAGQVSWRLGEFTWPQALRRHAETDVALIPIGSLEQHGPHLPLDVDTWEAAHLAEEVARACSEPRPLVLPAVPYGVSYHHDHFAGTVSIDPETLARLVYEIGMSVARNGVRKLVIVNGHGGNVPALHLAAQRLDRDARVFVAVDSGETSEREVATRFGTPQDLHAGEVETSTTLATRPHLVDMVRRRAEAPPISHRHLDLTSSHAVPWFHRSARVSGSGVLGDPTRASADKGRQIWEIRVRGLVRLVAWLQQTPVEQLHEAGA